MEIEHVAAACRARVSRDGWLAVADAPVWITRDGDPHDHVLQPGDLLPLHEGDRLVIEPWQADRAARLTFVSSRAEAPLDPLQALAVLAELLAAGLEQAARAARKMADRVRPYPVMRHGRAP
ncbi:DUF2917 domain-containing protein [Sphaerotilus uruguayifluvii]|uniref:DUF2917 domain-containing protein n=1 Tax=Sphaerotilus uruguayifluvii TaxID=2735897 RepID=A0ABX2G538_9BURK|nr:DUF2917 domain-containing protein [Leptothrix sp. C29]NRT57407.1 hypothetical protein [Leptothrix sp. C29]